MSRRSLVSVLTFGSLGVSFTVSVVWFCDVTGPARFEPGVTALGVVGVVLGVFADRLAARAELRSSTVRSLVEELDADVAIVGDPRFRTGLGGPTAPCVFPRLHLSAVDAAIASGGLAAVGDEELARQLHRWRDTVKEFNRRLDLTEMRTFMVNDPGEIRALGHALVREGGYLEEIDRQLGDLRRRLRPAENDEAGAPAALRPAPAARPVTLP